MDIRYEAFTIIHKVLKKNLFSDKLLDGMHNKIMATGDDSSLLYPLVKGVIKMRRNLDYIASQYTDKNKFQKTSLKIKIVIYMAIYQLKYLDGVPEHAAVNESVRIAKKVFGIKIANFINAVLRSYLRNPEIVYPDDMVERIAVEYSFSNEIIEKWIEYWGEEKTVKLCQYYNEAPKLSMRVNKFATEPKLLKKYFERRDVKLDKTEISENILITGQIKKVLSDVALSEGYFSIQDGAAALVVEFLNPQLKENNLDLFAAPGGKATYIAELMMNTGMLTAVDKFPVKIKKLKRAMERLQLTNIKPYAEDAFQFGPQVADFDRVLLDVPCSGWGVFQKKSELRWQINQDMKQLLKLQRKALNTGAKFVKLGGYLLYSTCTLNKEENENQIKKFLEKNKNFTLIDASSELPNRYTENGYLKILPFRDKFDGAFAAKMQKAELK